jgi:hypothetical protein
MDASVATRRVPPPLARAATTCSAGVGPCGHHLHRWASAQRAGSRQAPQRRPWPPAGRAPHAPRSVPMACGVERKGPKEDKAVSLCRIQRHSRRPAAVWRNDCKESRLPDYSTRQRCPRPQRPRTRCWLYPPSLCLCLWPQFWIFFYLEFCPNLIPT